MTTFATGRAAEQAAAEYLVREGFEIIDQNWKTRLCEIDIVARRNNTVYFVEVKYRKTSNQGSGLDYITDKKLRQMTFAAEIWVQHNNWRGEYCLGAIELSGVRYDTIVLVEIA